MRLIVGCEERVGSQLNSVRPGIPTNEVIEHYAWIVALVGLDLHQVGNRLVQQRHVELEDPVRVRLEAERRAGLRVWQGDLHLGLLWVGEFFEIRGGTRSFKVLLDYFSSVGSVEATVQVEANPVSLGDS